MLNSVTTLGLRDRRAGTVTFTTSLGFGRKLERIAHDPRIAVAYHTRQHGYSDRPGYVLVQGMATVHPDYPPQQREALREQAARHIGQLATGRFWDWWLRVYYEDRVGVEVRARRILWWPSGSLRDRPEVFGEALPADGADPQRPPRHPTAPRVSMKKVRRSAAHRPVHRHAHGLATGGRHRRVDAAQPPRLHGSAPQDAAAPRQRRGRPLGLPESPRAGPPRRGPRARAVICLTR